MELRDIFENTNNWLKYAEAKHVILIGFVGAGLFSTLNLLEHFCNWNIVLQVWIYFCITLFIISCLISLTSFMPILFPLKNKKQTKKINLIYFKDIATKEPEEYLLLLGISNPDSISLSLSEQIIINSRIAVYKFKLFSISLWLILIGLFPPFAFILFIKLVYKKFKK